MYYKELAHAWRVKRPTIGCLQAGKPGKLVVSLHSKSEGIRTRGTKGISPGPSLRAGDQGTSSVSQAEIVNSSFFHLFVLVRLSVDWIMPAHTLKTICLTEPTNSNAIIQMHLFRHSQTLCLAKYLGTPWLVKLTNKINQHIVPALKELTGNQWRFCSADTRVVVIQRRESKCMRMVVCTVLPDFRGGKRSL